MELVLNALRELMPQLELQTSAQLVVMVIPLLLAQKLLLTVKPVIKRMLDVSLAQLLMLASAQNALQVIL